ncbi:biotin--[acetyl-CoA-carboxylase] ligase [Lutibacter sp. A80]|uniref:biotin--[acetyl-CoA-carboxylase] ligase n=1 Tax=Lutibacter sp. A80 TaxID=2918453 RepID=UPI001F05C89D|nr:biotin--[acetyl-CoA-carboxylase] ligase [Lutibacter sp. A80]UMB60473.1 biotin--[acetyl-CoA-carboxylase] ligase [Lutibacter sp. A80]
MNIIKLNAIDSTNSYLKKLVQKSTLDTFTVVVAKHQTLGRGQLGTTWVSEQGKNLTFSILVNFKSFKIQDQFYLSMAVSLGLISALRAFVDVPFKIKWPNDILAEKDKIAGILIENILRGAFINYSIIGIGLNVNQEIFPNDIENVTSLKKLSGTTFNEDELLSNILVSIEKYVKLIEEDAFESLKKMYLAELYKINTPAMFEDNEGEIFLGKIISVDVNGRLVVELENETTRKFNLKEIKFASR